MTLLWLQRHMQEQDKQRRCPVGQRLCGGGSVRGRHTPCTPSSTRFGTSTVPPSAAINCLLRLPASAGLSAEYCFRARWTQQV